MSTLDGSLVALRSALVAPPRQRGWGWLVRQRISAVKDALQDEPADVSDAWLTARGSTVLRDRRALLARLTALGPEVLASAPDADLVVRAQRLLVDLEHHRQRLRDLVYDSVALELGGSE